MKGMATINPELKQDIQNILNRLERGNIEINHTLRLLLSEIDDHNVDGIAALLPPSVLEELKTLALAMPHSDAEWDKYIDIALCTMCFDPSVTKEQIDQMILKAN